MLDMLQYNYTTCQSMRRSQHAYQNIVFLNQ